MRILIACEFSGRVRDACVRLGHNAVSCDLEPTETPGDHYRGDVRDILDDGWDMMIAFPPCTYLCGSGARWMRDPERQKPQAEALDFVRVLLGADIPRIALENPVGIISTQIRKPDQIIHPWQYGHGEKKRTCIWLKNLPLLRPTKIVDGRTERVFRNVAPGPERWKIRSRTYQGIANAMAFQWGGLATEREDSRLTYVGQAA